MWREERGWGGDVGGWSWMGQSEGGVNEIIVVLCKQIQSLKLTQDELNPSMHVLIDIDKGTTETRPVLPL